ncbi:hypothetical protein BDW66DRAFT_123160 [Aspergillus desertorum]
MLITLILLILLIMLLIVLLIMLIMSSMSGLSGSSQFGQCPNQDFGRSSSHTITSRNALTSLRTLRLYLEQQEEGDTALIRLLNRLENNIQRQEIQKRRQVDIRGYFRGQS